MYQSLIELTIKNPGKFSYINLDEKHNYKGWVSDFNLTYMPKNQRLFLDLKQEENLFLLFVLASAWSRTGPWENALFFTAFLKVKYDILDLISKQENIDATLYSFDVKEFKGIDSRRKISFRSDFYDSVNVLIQHWNEIKGILKKSENENNWQIFINYISSLEGLGAGSNKMQIKIPFILRELRCQKIYNNIDGKYCCIADQRVRDTYKEMKKPLPNNYLKASEIIYQDFEDLYDIPAFAYKDFKEQYYIQEKLVSDEEYIQSLENKTYQELIDIKDDLVACIKYFENNTEELLKRPSIINYKPNFMYEINLYHLSYVIKKMIREF